MKQFIFLYILYMLIAFGLFGYGPVATTLKINHLYTLLVTDISGYLIQLVGIKAQISGDLILMQNTTLKVEFGCNGLEAILLFSAAVLAYPASLKQKMAGLLLGFFGIQFFNLIRIVVLAWVSQYHPDMFDTMHTYVTQSVMIVIAFMTFIFYLYKVTPLPDEK
jgi:exosortase family protein XrtM